MGEIFEATNLLLGFAVAVMVVLAYVVYRHGKRKASEKVFSVFIIAAAVWVATNLIANLSISGDPAVYLLWTRSTLLGPIFIPLLFLLFACYFPDNKPVVGRQPITITLLISLFFLALLPTDLFIKSVQVIDVNQQLSSFEVGPIFIYFLAFLGIGIFVSIYYLFKKYFLLGRLEKLQLRLVLVGILVSALLGVFTSAILPLFGVNQLINVGSSSVIFFIVATTFAILRYQLLDIRLVVTEIATYIALVILVVEIFLSETTTEIIFRVFFLAIAIYGGRLLIKSMQLEVSRRKEVEGLAKERARALDELAIQNKHLATLQRISDIVLNENDTKAMTQKILDELPKQLDSCVGGLLSITKDGKLTAYAISRNNLSQKVVAMIGGSLEKYSFPIKKEYNRIHEALVDKKSIDSDNLTDFISPPIPKAVAASIQTLTGAKHVEVFPLYAGGEPLGVMLFVFNRPGAEVHDKNYAIAKAISDDLSLAVQRAQAFEQLKAANEYLAQLDKMKDEFISMASHELNTPLAAIEGYLSMILDEGMGKIDKQSRTYLNRAYASSKRLAELILDLLNVSRIEQGRLKMKYEEIAVAEMIESVIHELQIKADGKKIYLKIDIAKDLPKVWCDPDRIREVIVNLTGNAIKFTEKGGITIKASQPDAKNIRVQVVDTGRGVAKEDQSKLFQKFSQVKRQVDEHQGSGLGLYISKNFVELHNGKIWVDSEVGKGATFSFELPLIKEPPKEVKGAVLEGPLSAPRIERGNPMEVPTGIKESAKKT